jgi:hypothetical protein
MKNKVIKSPKTVTRRSGMKKEILMMSLMNSSQSSVIEPASWNVSHQELLRGGSNIEMLY